LAEELKKAFELEVELLKSSGGRFEIYLNSELIFSKIKSGRFPESGEINSSIRERLKG